MTGLDPAKPFISASNATQRLDSTDANFVDVIHTSGGIIAMETPVRIRFAFDIRGMYNL